MHPVQSYSAENGNMRVQIDKTGQKCFSAAVSSVFCAVISLVYGRNRSVFNLYRTAITADASGDLILPEGDTFRSIQAQAGNL